MHAVDGPLSCLLSGSIESVFLCPLEVAPTFLKRCEFQGLRLRRVPALVRLRVRSRVHLRVRNRTPHQRPTVQSLPSQTKTFC